jgi:thiol:disulfide interchange protein DsbD
MQHDRAGRRLGWVSAAIAASVLLLPSLSFGQTVLTIAPPVKITAKTGSTMETKIHLHLGSEYHANSNTPSDDFLIPMRLTWSAGPLESTEVIYPKPEMGKYSFSDKPLSVFSGDFDIVTKFKVAATANPGPTVVAGKLRYQACNDRMCLPPKTLDVSLPVDVVK